MQYKFKTIYYMDFIIDKKDPDQVVNKPGRKRLEVFVYNAVGKTLRRYETMSAFKVDTFGEGKLNLPCFTREFRGSRYQVISDNEVAFIAPQNPYIVIGLMRRIACKFKITKAMSKGREVEFFNSIGDKIATFPNVTIALKILTAHMPEHTLRNHLTMDLSNPLNKMSVGPYLQYKKD